MKVFLRVVGCGEKSEIELPERCSIYLVQDDKSKFLVEWDASQGTKLLEAAVKQLDNSAEVSAKLGAYAKRRDHLERRGAYSAFMKQYELKVPAEVRKLFRTTIHLITSGDTTVAHRLCESFGKVNPENWKYILHWYHDNVLASVEGKSKYQLRKSLITLVSKMGKANISESMLNRVIRDNDDEYWDSYISSKNT